ncbi:MAG: FliA/WhiG family RNA polymerase sigma factor [Planctomycetota bacterium]
MARNTTAAPTRNGPTDPPQAPNSRELPAAAAFQELRRLRRPDDDQGDVEEVWRVYKRTGDPNLRNVLIEKYLPLVRYISERLLVSLPKSIELDDLQSAGVFGLMDAIEGFDLDRGIKFKTYCTTRIRGSILDELRSQDWVPRLVRLKAHQINKALRTLEVELGREPTDYEMARKLGVSLEEYSSMIEESSPKTVYSLSEKWDENDDDDALEKVEMIEDKNSLDPVENLNQKDILQTITRSLSKKEKLIIIMYYYEGLTMREIGDILSLTESRVCQIHSNVMSKLKVHLEKVKQKLLA